jgi:hypothetical protein
MRIAPAALVATAALAVAVAACSQSEFTGDPGLLPPGHLSAVTALNGGGQVILRWDPSPIADGYRVHVDGTDHDFPAGAQGASVSLDYTIPGPHRITIRALLNGRAGPPSGPIEMTFTNSPLDPQPLWSGSGATPGTGFGLSIAAGVFDGDGSRDLAVGAPLALGNAGQIVLYRGIRGGLGPAPRATVNGGAAGDLFGAALDAADTGNDGYDDLVAGAPGYNAGEGGILELAGGALGLATNASVIAINGGVANGHFGAALAFARGASLSLLVGSPGNAGNPGRVRLLPMAGGNVSASPLWTTTSDGPAGDGFGSTLAALSDGRFVAGLPFRTPTAGLDSAGRIEVRSLSGTGALLWSTAGGLAGGHLGWSVAAGDVDGDGAPDLVAGEPDAQPPALSFPTGETRFWRGSGAGFQSTNNPSSGDENGERRGISVAILERLYTTDGGVMVGAPGRPVNGAVLHYFDGFGLSEDAFFNPGLAPAGTVVRNVGDFDGDGLDDIAVTDPGAGHGRVAIYPSRTTYGPQANAGEEQEADASASPNVFPIGASFSEEHFSPGGYRCTWTWDDDPVPQVVDDCQPDDPAPASIVGHGFGSKGDHWVTLHVDELQKHLSSESTTRIRVH